MSLLETLATYCYKYSVGTDLSICFKSSEI